MKVLNELLHIQGVTAHREGVNYHFLLRNHIAGTQEVLADVPPKEIYEYAGFKYEVTRLDGQLIMKPVDGQHSAAGKMKHVNSARECYLADKANV